MTGSAARRTSKQSSSTPLLGIHIDRWLLVTSLLLLAFGLLMVASASMVISDRQFHYPFHYFFHQGVYLALGIVFAAIAVAIPTEFWQRISIPFMLAGLLLLVLVLIPGVGHVVNGSRRWIYLGVLSLQVSEVVKLCALIYLASYLQRHIKQVRHEFFGFAKPMILLAVMAILLLRQPDFGAVAVLSMMFLIVLFLAGARLWPFSLLFLLVVATLVALAVTSPYRLQRLTTFLNPWGAQYGSGYQLTQSLIAFGRGGLWGVGLGNSVQKLFYLPEAHTDFLFAVIVEELGLLGAIALLTLFVFLLVRIFQIGRRAEYREQLFHAYVCYGAAVWLGLQAMINLGVNAGVLPTKGLTLPFISYGGSSMLVNCVVIGIVMRIAHAIRLPQR